MPRNMSFSMTTDQMTHRTKRVTRRDGWWNLKPGDLLWAVEKAMGLKKGETMKRISLIRVKSVRQEPVGLITPEDVKLEGFPDWDVQQFLDFFCAAHGCGVDKVVNRIAFGFVTLDPVMPVAVPPSLAVCPICGGKLVIVECGQWVEGEKGLMIPDEIYMECEHAPEIEDEEWEAWFDGHYRMPYVDWLPVHGKVERWFAMWFRYTKT